jgi:hypothetical protein
MKYHLVFEPTFFIRRFVHWPALKHGILLYFAARCIVAGGSFLLF